MRIRLEYGDDRDLDTLKTEIEQEIRQELIFQAAVELVPERTLAPQGAMKTKLVARCPHPLGRFCIWRLGVDQVVAERAPASEGSQLDAGRLPEAISVTIRSDHLVSRDRKVGKRFKHKG